MLNEAMQRTAAELASKAKARGFKASALRDHSSFGTMLVDDPMSGTCIGHVTVYQSGRYQEYTTAGVRLFG